MLRAGEPPTILIYHEGIYYTFGGNLTSTNEMINVINKIINPVIDLTTELEIEDFLRLDFEV